MAKLPENFVKPPNTTSRLTKRLTAPKQARRARKAELEAVAAEHVYDVLVRLSPEEHQALSSACAALATVGETVSIEDMIRTVIARWMAATQAMQATQATAPHPPISHESVVAQLRRLAEQPLRYWRALGATMRRWVRRA
jgi:hypothetical protein